MPETSVLHGFSIGAESQKKDILHVFKGTIRMNGESMNCTIHSPWLKCILRTFDRETMEPHCSASIYPLQQFQDWNGIQAEISSLAALGNKKAGIQNQSSRKHIVCGFEVSTKVTQV